MYNYHFGLPSSGNLQAWKLLTKKVWWTARVKRSARAWQDLGLKILSWAVFDPTIFSVCYFGQKLFLQFWFRFFFRWYVIDKSNELWKNIYIWLNDNSRRSKLFGSAAVDALSDYTRHMVVTSWLACLQKNLLFYFVNFFSDFFLKLKKIKRF